MESKKAEYLAWYGLAFERADINHDKELSLTEFLRGTRDYYGGYFNIIETDLQNFYNINILPKNSTKEAVQNGLWKLDSEEMRGREWDLMKDVYNGSPCLLKEEFMNVVCDLALYNSVQAFRLYDVNMDDQVTKEEFRNTTDILGRNQAQEEIQWRMLDENKNGKLELWEMRLFTMLTLQVM